MQCPDFDVSTPEVWERCGRIRAYVAIAVTIVIVLILVWIFSRSGSFGWGVAVVGLLVVGGMAFMLPDYMGESKASEHAGLWRRVKAKEEGGVPHRDAVHMVKTEHQLETLQRRGNNGNGNSSLLAGVLVGNALGRR